MENADARDSFVWKSNWYPVCPEIDMDKAVPHGFQVRILVPFHHTCGKGMSHWCSQWIFTGESVSLIWSVISPSSCR